MHENNEMKKMIKRNVDSLETCLYIKHGVMLSA